MYRRYQYLGTVGTGVPVYLCWLVGGGGVKYQKGSQKSKHNIPGHKITNVPTVGTFLKYLPVPTCFALRKLLYAAMMQKYKRRHTMLMYNAELH